MHDGANLIFVSRGYRPEGRNGGETVGYLRWTADLSYLQWLRPDA